LVKNLKKFGQNVDIVLQMCIIANMNTSGTDRTYEFVDTPNRYGGYCCCGTYVYAQKGFYSNGQLFCTQPRTSVNGVVWVCEVDEKRGY